MSHKATQWAIQQRGLKPATKLVLWFLADRHNPDYGCFPMQTTLAEDAEVSRSSLNNHLDELEAKGLIRRAPRVDQKTGKQMSTRYILGFEFEASQKPSPKSGHGEPETKTEHAPSAEPDFLGDQAGDNLGENLAAESKSDPEPSPKNSETRVQNLDTNPVSEPVNKEEEERERENSLIQISDEFMLELTETLGLLACERLPPWWVGEPAREHVRGWVRSYGFSAARILEIAADSRKSRPEPPDGPKALDRFMERAAHTSKSRKEAASAAPPTIQEKAEWFADLINSDRFIAPNSIKAELASYLVANKLVTPERMKKRGQM